MVILHEPAYLHVSKEGVVDVEIVAAVTAADVSIGRCERGQGQSLDSLAILEQQQLRLLNVLLRGEATASVSRRIVVPIQGRLQHVDAVAVPLFRLHFIKANWNMCTYTLWD